MFQLEEEVKNRLVQLLEESCNDQQSCVMENMSVICDQVLSELEEQSNNVSRKRRQVSIIALLFY